MPWPSPLASPLATTAGLTLGLFLLAGCATLPGRQARADHLGPGVNHPGFANISYASWRDDEPDYRLYPGDVLEVAVPSAPELARTVTVQPDGRIRLPLITPTMAADRSTPQLEADLSALYASQLVRPEIEVSVKSATPLRVFVGGEVQRPGVYDMPGDINALQAVIMAGGFLPTGNRSQVVIVRRSGSGRPMMRRADLRGAVFQPGSNDAVPLRRFDIIYVPRTGIAAAGLFVQQYIRELVPIQFSYAVTPNAYVTVP